MRATRWHTLAAAAAAALMALIAAAPAVAAPENAGLNQPSPVRPFVTAAVATFDTPWAIAFLPDGRMLVTEKGGALFRVSQNGRREPVAGVPPVQYEGQNGLLDVAISPTFARDRIIYLTYVAASPAGGALTLLRARLSETVSGLSLAEAAVIWRQTPDGGKGQPGGVIAFSPDGRHLFLTVGDRMIPQSAQDPDQARGKVLRLNLDGSVPPDNPWAAAGGVRAQTWTTGHRNAYGLAFAPDGQLWLHEMGPMGGDEFNLILPGRNYGWPVVSNGDNYNGTPIPRHDTRPEFEGPALYWNPVIAPAGLVFYEGTMFPQWRGSALIGALKATALVRVAFDKAGAPHEVDRWDMGERIRDVAVAPDGAVWLIEDSPEGRLLRLTPAAH